MLGVIAALSAEAECFVGKKVAPQTITRVQDSAFVYVSGMGGEYASEAARLLLRLGADALLSWGTAGGLNPLLRSGTLMVPFEVTDGLRSIPVDQSWRERLVTAIEAPVKVCDEPILTTSDVQHTAADKLTLWDRTAASAVDMESYFIGSEALKAQVPFLAVRSVVDEADFLVPCSALAGSDRFGRPCWLPLLVTLLRRPQDVPELFALSRRFDLALKTLGRVSKLTASALDPQISNPNA